MKTRMTKQQRDSLCDLIEKTVRLELHGHLEHHKKEYIEARKEFDRLFSNEDPWADREVE